MKKINELGVSPTPWSTYKTKRQVTVLASCSSGEDIDVCECRGSKRENNARLIAAAPDLYEALEDAVNSRCKDCRPLISGERLTRFCNDECQVARWRKALAKV